MERAVTDEVKNVMATLPQLGGEIVQRSGRTGGERCDADVAHAGLCPRQFAGHVYGHQSKLRKVGRISDDDQCAELGLRTKPHWPPIHTAQVAGEQDLLAVEQPATVLRVLQNFPTQAVQFGRAWIDEESNPQSRILSLGGATGLVERRQNRSVLEETLAQESSVR